MKTFIVAFNLCLLLADPAIASAAEGSAFFVDHDDLIPSRPTGERMISPSDLEKVRSRSEYLPAELDPDGNWGESSGGAQIGIRFPRVVYPVGDAIEAAVIVRNVGNEPLSYVIGSPIELFLTVSIISAADGKAIPRRAEARAKDDFQRRLARLMHNPKTFQLAPGTQRRHLLKLSDMFDIPAAGGYSVSSSLQLNSGAGEQIAATTATVALAVTNRTPGIGRAESSATAGSTKEKGDSASTVAKTNSDPAPPTRPEIPTKTKSNTEQPGATVIQQANAPATEPTVATGNSRSLRFGLLVFLPVLLAAGWIVWRRMKSNGS